ncbi:prealbumin-like fold domain-containing protein [Bifidobacterium samirii]|uniref:SpaA-like prealbumin fold domain-containing protein n=1 Tax=Bifidobacterium samirii TaxID=2306974 RepID=A0A430FR87_9BIFI|nr:prealbumin-like fold domain-containing protein [Bifidobacterium samirii]RSX55334.1 hypothetical protein D2E24_1349 [Bifidobacterium samirii]
MPQITPGSGRGHGVSIRRTGKARSWTNRLVALITALMMAISLFAAPSTALADDLGVTLPATWDQDMAQYFPDETLRTLVTQEIANEFQGQNFSAKSTQDVLAMMKGDYGDGTWYLNLAYKRSGLKPVQVLNGIQYLNGLSRIFAENIGLQVLAMPDVDSSAKIPDLNLGRNALHIFPQDMYTEYNFPQTKTMNIQVSEANYHHAQVTYVRDGSGQDKVIDINAKIFRLINSDTGDLSQITSEQVLDDMQFSTGTADQSFTTAEGATVSDPDAVGWDISGFSQQAVEGLIVKNAQFDHVVRHKAGNNSNCVTLSYYYALGVDFLSTVGQEVSTVTLADFSFTKKADATGQPLKGAEYVIRTADGRYVKGKGDTAEVDANGTLATVDSADSEEVLKLTTNENGQFTAHDLPATEKGVTYTVVEVKAPDGYSIDKETKETPVVVKCHANAATPVTDGGEGAEASITNSNVIATADQWDSNTLSWQTLSDGSTDYMNSGNAMTLTTKDGSPVTQTKSAKNFNGGDQFIRNGGNNIALTMQIGTDYEVRNASTDLLTGGKVTATYKADGVNAATTNLTQAQSVINDIIQNSRMKKNNDYYNVNTTMVVHDKNSLDLNSGTQDDPAEPVTMRFSAKKILKDLSNNEVAFGDRTFEVSITPANEAAEDLAAQNEGFGSITLDKDHPTNVSSVLSISNEMYKKWRNGGTGEDANVSTFSFLASEVNPCETNGSEDERCYGDIKYDDTQYRIDIAVSETQDPNEQGVTHGLTANITISNADTGEVLTTTTTNSASDRTLTVGAGKLTYHNTVNPTVKFTKTDADGKALAGAEFTLYRCTTGRCSATAIDPDKLADGWTLDKNRTQTSDENGIVTFAGLADGEYRLVETKAPAGYLKPDGQWSIVVENGEVGEPTAVRGKNGGNPPAFQIVKDKDDTDATDDKPAWSVANYTPSDVPHTGATGLIGVAAAGTLLITAGAGVIAIDAKRRSRRTRS